MTALSPTDPNSFARPDEAIVSSLHLDIAVDFDARILKGHVDFDVTRVKPDAEFVTLDSKGLKISGAVCVDSGEKLVVDRSLVDELFGTCTKIRLPAGEKFKIRVSYETSADAGALLWMTKEQTAGKKHPYVFSQCEAIYARSMLPCQDTPSVKAPYSAKIRVPKDLTAVFSGLRTGEEAGPDNTKVFSFNQKVPTPIYLCALAVGDLKSRKIGPRTTVWSEEEYVDKATVDFADTEQMLQAAEQLMGEYVWGVYDLLVLPPSFPFGGMENPCITFITPTLLAGDKSLATVIAHEIAHSWTGNLVTNKTFEHFWLNEGFTMYVERKIIAKMFGEERRQLAAITGLKDLEYAVETDLGKDNPLTKLVVDLRGIDPEDAFSTVPYEKGHSLLYHLETLLGADRMEAYLKATVERFKYKSYDTDEWKAFLYEFFADKRDVLDKIDWNAWLYTVGMPPVIPDYKTPLIEPCQKLSAKWVNATDDEVKTFEKSEFDELIPDQKVEVLNLLLKAKGFSKEKVIALTKIYGMEDVINCEIRFRWLRLGMIARWEAIIDPVTKFIETYGRMKYIAPLFRDLGQWPEKRQYALDLYERLKPNMMKMLKGAVEDALKLKK